MNAEQATTPRVILVTGPARSGKSEWAEMLAIETNKPRIYLATARVDPNDSEWVARIAKHVHRRTHQGWKTWEVPILLAEALLEAPKDSCLLVDSLGTWVANLLAEEDATWEQMQRDLIFACSLVGEVIFVAEETGWGVVPAYPSGRKFRDRLGSLVRRVGAIAHTTYLVTGGHALNLSQLGTPLPPSSG